MECRSEKGGRGERFDEQQRWNEILTVTFDVARSDGRPKSKVNQQGDLKMASECVVCG